MTARLARWLRRWADWLDAPNRVCESHWDRVTSTKGNVVRVWHWAKDWRAEREA